MKNPKNIVITGASSGIGAALARHYAKSGVNLYLQGRNPARLAEVADACRAQGANVQEALLDVTDATNMQTWLLAADAASPIDLVIANAGISAGIGGAGEDATQVRALFAVNIDGVINSIQPLLPSMMKRKHGQIALMSSLAGIRGLATSPAYSASKACVRIYGEGMRGWLASYGVEVNVICPGFIRTPLTDTNPYYMPFLMEPEEAADRIAHGLARNQARIAFPRRLYLPLWWVSCLPPALTDPFFALLPKKPSGV